MEVDITDDVLTKKHDRLWRIAYILKIFAWIALISQTIYAGFQFFETQNSLIASANFYGHRFTLREILDDNLWFSLKIFINVFITFIHGIIYWLMLKGISLGLFMIIETDVNYREKIQEENDER